VGSGDDGDAIVSECRFDDVCSVIQKRITVARMKWIWRAVCVSCLCKLFVLIDVTVASTELSRSKWLVV
jgi:hypothetical protein